MRYGLLLLALTVACTGCTTPFLKRNTVALVSSSTDLRYREVLDNLAMVADDPAALPAYSSVFAGGSQITDNAQLTSTTIWQRVLTAPIQNGFMSEAANPQVSRVVSDNWTLDPIAVPEKIEAMRCACRWVIYGPERACADCRGLLATPEQAPYPGRHFGVADRLARLPKGWLHVGKLKDVPTNACYRAHRGDTWVWVMPDGMEGLSDFTLILQDIARVYSNSLTLFYIPPAPGVFTFQTEDAPLPDGTPGAVVATVNIDGSMNLVPDLPYYRPRLDNVGSNAFLRSQITAASLR
jgi:hypothetical protein